MDDFNLINEIYAGYFSAETAPARECVQVEKLPRNVNIEISMIHGRFFYESFIINNPIKRLLFDSLAF